MGIYIKGMEMPKSCPCELTGVGYDLYCSFVYGIPKRVREYYECCENGTRPDWCPLIEVSEPHGRLIDEKHICDKIRPLIENPYCYNRLQVISETLGNCLQIVRDAPTIIPESKEGET